MQSRSLKDFGLWTLELVPVAKPKQPAINLCHSFYSRYRIRRSFDRRVKLIAQQMPDVIHKQLLMLHLVLESKPDQGQNRFRIAMFCDRLQKPKHPFVNMIAIGNSLFDGRTRLRAALRPLDTCAKPFIVRIEVEEKLLRVRLIAGFVSLYERFEE